MEGSSPSQIIAMSSDLLSRCLSIQFIEALIFPPINQAISPLIRLLFETLVQGEIQSKYFLA